MMVFKTAVTVVTAIILFATILYTCDQDNKFSKIEKVLFALVILTFAADIYFIWR